MRAIYGIIYCSMKMIDGAGCKACSHLFVGRGAQNPLTERGFMAGAKNVVETVREGITPIADELGLQIWDIEFLKEGSRRILRVTIDHEDGITIDDCERMHRAIDPVLDELDPIEESYDLEVSSPGIERELRTDAHIDFAIGEMVELRLFAPINGQKRYKGILAERTPEREIVLDLGEERLAFPRSAISKMCTVFEFGNS